MEGAVAFKHLIQERQADFYDLEDGFFLTQAETRSVLAALMGDIATTRRSFDEYLRRNFYTTAEVARMLSASERLVQAMAAQGATSYRCASGDSIVLGLRSIQHRGYRFPKADIDRLMASSRLTPRS